jgi:UDP-2,3-diacylglucosamine hydrolase
VPHYFASDFHLGAPDYETSRAREARIVRWLDTIRPDAESLYLVGDLFDFWFEYGTVVPKGHVRLLGRLAEWRDAGIPVHVFTGNHDLWMFGYLEQELGVEVHHKPLVREIGGKRFFIGHGDGLGPGDHGYKFLKKIFTHPFLQWAFRWLHPDVGARIAVYSSRKSRAAQPEETFVRAEDEWLWAYANRKLRELPELDYFVFGHRHLALDLALENGHCRYINLGEWFRHCTYAVFDGQRLELRTFEQK